MFRQQQQQHQTHTHTNTKYTLHQFIHLMFKQKPKLLLIFLIPRKEKNKIQHDNNLANFVYNGFDIYTHTDTHTYKETQRYTDLS